MVRTSVHALSSLLLSSLVLGSLPGCASAPPPEPEEPVASPGPIDEGPTEDAPTDSTPPAATAETANNAPPPPYDPELSSDLVLEKKLTTAALPAGPGTYVVGTSACDNESQHLLLRIERPGESARQTSLGEITCNVTKKGTSLLASKVDAGAVRYEIRSLVLAPSTTGIIVDIFEEAEPHYHWAAVLLSSPKSLQEGWGYLQGRLSGQPSTHELLIRPKGELWATSTSESRGRNFYEVDVLALSPEGQLVPTPHPVSLAKAASLVPKKQIDIDAAAAALEQKCPALAKRIGRYEGRSESGEFEIWLGIASPLEQEAEQALRDLNRCGIKDATMVTLPTD